MKSKRMRWLGSWIFWVFIIVGCATFLLPKIPYYQDWMPYRYDLGGMALVVLYLSFGFLNLGLYGLVMGGLSWRSDSLDKVGPYALPFLGMSDVGQVFVMAIEEFSKFMLAVFSITVLWPYLQETLNCHE
jgi:hypothetical protein